MMLFLVANNFWGIMGRTPQFNILLPQFTSPNKITFQHGFTFIGILKAIWKRTSSRKSNGCTLIRIEVKPSCPGGEMADARDLKSRDSKGSCGFESRPGHLLKRKSLWNETDIGTNYLGFGWICSLSLKSQKNKKFNQFRFPSWSTILFSGQNWFLYPVVKNDPSMGRWEKLELPSKISPRE